MEEPGRLQSMGSQSVGHDRATSLVRSSVSETKDKVQINSLSVSFISVLRRETGFLQSRSLNRFKKGRIFLMNHCQKVQLKDFRMKRVGFIRKYVLSILSRVKQITSPGWMHEAGVQGWCTGKTQRDGMRREAGGGVGMGNTCKSMADSCQCMAKTTTIL